MGTETHFLVIMKGATVTARTSHKNSPGQWRTVASIKQCKDNRTCKRECLRNCYTTDLCDM